MSLNLIGRREKPKRKHRADDRIAELEALVKNLRGDNAKLLNRQAEADDYFALLKHDVDTTNAAWQQEKTNRKLAEQSLTQAENVIRLRDQRIADLERKVDVGVKAEHIIAKTQPIPVITPVMPLYEAPFATTDPGHVPTWAKDEEAAAR